MEDNSSKTVAEKARETYFAIRKLRKNVPQFTRGQKDELARREKELQDKWWNEVKKYMKKDENYPPFKMYSSN